MLANVVYWQVQDWLDIICLKAGFELIILVTSGMFLKTSIMV